jgi:ABC-type lipoprotein release transport system permease subunit
MMDTGMKLIFVFAFLAILVGVIALVVWVKIVKGKKRDNSDRGTRFE